MAQAIKHLQLVVEQIDEPLPGVKRLTLVDQDHWRLPAFRPGAHIDLHLKKGLVRTYSLCNNPADCRRYVVAVKREATGRGGSIYIHDQLCKGQVIRVSVPRSGLDFSTEAMNIFIAGGIGITPFVSAIRTPELEGKSDYVLHWASMGKPSLIDMLEPAGASQGSCRLIHATNRVLSSACVAASMTLWRSGLSVTTLIGDQLRVRPAQRAGWRSRAWRYV